MRAEWGMTEKNREARFYSLTATGRKQLAHEEESWKRLTEGVARVIGYAERVSVSMAWLQRFWNVVRPGRVQRDLERELAFHVTERAEELRESGMSEAARRARRAPAIRQFHGTGGKDAGYGHSRLAGIERSQCAATPCAA